MLIEEKVERLFALRGTVDFEGYCVVVEGEVIAELDRAIKNERALRSEIVAIERQLERVRAATVAHIELLANDIIPKCERAYEAAEAMYADAGQIAA